MIETFVLLLTAHLLADFVFQPDRLVAAKQRLSGALLHAAVVGALTLLALAPRTPSAMLPVAIVVVSHALMDWLKAQRLGAALWAFILDQVVHLAVAAGLAWVWPEMARQSAWALLPGDQQAYLYAGLVQLCAIVVAVPVGGIVIRKLVEPLTPTALLRPALPPGTSAANVSATPAPIVGMPSAGRYIGWLERGLTIIFVFTKQFEAIGFLLAAKSILRFSDVRNETDRHQAEYIIIGTFLSFGWAILVALAGAAAVAHWRG